MALSKMEFMVENISDKETLKKIISSEPGISRVEVVGKESVVIESTLTCEKAKNLIQNVTGGSVVLQGLGEQGAAVSIVSGEGVQGIIRFGGTSSESHGVVDGTVDGLLPGRHRLQIHEAGDLSRACESIGPVLKPHGDLGYITVENDGRADFKFALQNNKISDIIGRSVAISTDKEKRLACGVIARSAGLFQNSKNICACDGITLWDEKYVPSAGGARSSFAKKD